jgi:hypothetical protein
MSDSKTRTFQAVLTAIVATLVLAAVLLPGAAAAQSARGVAGLKHAGLVDPDELTLRCITGRVTVFRHQPNGPRARLRPGRTYYLGVKLPCRALVRPAGARRKLTGGPGQGQGPRGARATIQVRRK